MKKVKKYGLLLSEEYKDEIIIPIITKGKIVASQRRNFAKKLYLSSKSISHYLFYEDDILEKQPLILVEGFFDAVHVKDIIDSEFSDKISVTSGFTKSLAQKQFQKIINKNPSKIYCMFDGDSWMDYKRVEKNVPFDVIPIILPKEHDPNSMPTKELKKLMENEIEEIGKKGLLCRLRKLLRKKTITESSSMKKNSSKLIKKANAKRTKFC